MTVEEKVKKTDEIKGGADCKEAEEETILRPHFHS